MNSSKKQQPRLKRLAPLYEDEHHRPYVDFLLPAITGENPARNVALAGAYSSGKSSILQGLKDYYRNSNGKGYAQLVEISLTSLNQSESQLKEAHSEKSLSAVLQKEIVKQLLYSAPAKKLPHSRIRRTRSFRVGNALFTAVSALGLLMLAVLVFNGLEGMASLVEALALENVLGWIVIPIGALAVIFYSLWALKDIRISEFSFGGAKLGIASPERPYFDHYLEEIVYFFQATKTRYVILEDLDRFNDPGIFQSLRDLNILLNQSESIRQPVVFIYAIRDSLFDQTPKPEDVDENGEKLVENAETAATDRASNSSAIRPNQNPQSGTFGVDGPASHRSKFFDLIVPVVPFISHDVAADLLSKAMPAQYRPSEALIRLAGRHFTDMRTIHSIANEYIVFSDRLLSTSKVEGLNPDKQFAMVLYKHQYPTDFEEIRIGTSKLDKLVNGVENAKAKRLAKLDSLIEEHHKSETADLRKREFVEKAAIMLDTHFDLLAQGPRSVGTVEGLAVTGNSTQYQHRDLRSVSFWHEYASKPGVIRVTFSSGYVRDISEAQLKQLLMLEDLPAKFVASLEKKSKDELSDLLSVRNTLSRATFSQCVTGEWGSNLSTGQILGPFRKFLDFSDITRSSMGDELGLDLVRSGHIDNNFSLYTTAYYGEFLSPAARSFALTAIDKRKAEPYKSLTSTDVDRLIESYGPHFLLTASGLNINVFETLLGSDVLKPTLDALVAGVLDGDMAFTQMFFSTSARAASLVESLGPRWPRIIDCICQSTETDISTKLQLVDSAFKVLKPGVPYAVSDTSRQFLIDIVDQLDTLTTDLSKGTAKEVALLLGSNGILIHNLMRTTESNRIALASEGAFTITRENLEAIAPNRKLLGLDSFATIDKRIAIYLAGRLDEYLLAITSTGSPVYSVDNPKQLTSVLNLLHDIGGQDVDSVIEKAQPTARVQQFSSVPPSLWLSLVRADRFERTAQNCLDFLAAHNDELDRADLARVLHKGEPISKFEGASPEQRGELAIWIIGTDQLGFDRKRTLILRIQPPAFNAEEIVVKDGKLLGWLIKKGLLEDSATVFNVLRTLPWPEKVKAIAVAPKFADYAHLVFLSPNETGRLLQSQLVQSMVKDSLVQKVCEIEGLNAQSGSFIIGYARTRQFNFSPNQIRCLVRLRVAHSTIAGYIGDRGSHFSNAELTQLLSELSGDYRSLVLLAGKRPLLPASPGIARLLERLKEMGYVSKFQPEGSDKTRVFTKRKRAA